MKKVNADKCHSNSWLVSFLAAGKGIYYCVCTQRHMQVHLVAAAAVLLLAVAAGLTASEFCLLLLTIFAVLIAEMLNTAIETVVDLVSPEYHLLAGLAKDVAAGAVLLAAVAAILIGYLLFSPYLLFFAQSLNK